MLFANALSRLTWNGFALSPERRVDRLIDNSITIFRVGAQKLTRPAVHLMLYRIAPY